MDDLIKIATAIPGEDEFCYTGNTIEEAIQEYINGGFGDAVDVALIVTHEPPAISGIWDAVQDRALVLTERTHDIENVNRFAKDRDFIVDRHDLVELTRRGEDLAKGYK